MTRTIKDAAGRTIYVGDMVGATTGVPPSTVTGVVGEITYSRICITVVSVATPSKFAPAIGSEVWLLGRHAFLVHSTTPQPQAVRSKAGHVTSLLWSGHARDLRGAADFAGPDLIGAIDGEDGWTLFLRASKARNDPDVVPPGWFILRPPNKGRLRACDPAAYAASYAPIATEHTA